ncbi:MAG: molybdate ABC transporter permease subunit, partial [Burkholderiaceae bacterium]
MNQLSDAWPAIALTLKLASLSSFLLLIIATPLAWWLSQTKSLWRKPIGALITLPLVLPPTVLGFYILVLLGPKGWVGQLTQSLGIGVLSFSFTGLLIGSLVFSLPFAVQPIQYAFEAIGKRPLEVAATLRASPIDTFFSVALPLAKPGLLTATVLSFAHTLGEFGV